MASMSFTTKGWNRLCAVLGAGVAACLCVACGGGGDDGGSSKKSSATTCGDESGCGQCGSCIDECVCMTGDVQGCATKCGSSGDGGSGGASNGGTCDGKTCGADHAAHEFCGPPCPKGMGCSSEGACGPWPPDLDSIYDNAGGWQLPECSHDDDPGADLANADQYEWIKTMHTTATDCPQVLQDLHPMAKVGNVVSEDQSVYVNGSCAEYGYGEHWGTAYGGVLVWGKSWPGFFQGITYQINWRAIVDHNLSPASGKGVAHLSKLPGDVDCSIWMDVTYETCPHDRNDCGNYPVPY